MEKVIINAKGRKVLKEALRIVAFKNKISSSAFVISKLESDPDIIKELKKLTKNENTK